MPDLLSPRIAYKPFEYPQHFDFFQKQNQAHWMPTEVPMEPDIADFKFKMSSEERNLVKNILRFFTQGDVEVSRNYNTELIPAFPKPETKMMLSSFAAMEGVHIWAYSYLNDSLGLPDAEYRMFLDIPAMKAKYDFISSKRVNDPELCITDPTKLAYNLAIFGGFMEGVSLFSSFAILMGFARIGKLKGVGQIVTWSARDESLHSQGVCSLFRDFLRERPHLKTKKFDENIEAYCRRMVELEDDFIDACFSNGGVMGLAPEEVKGYIRYIANRRMEDLGYRGIYEVNENPLPWMDAMLNAKEHTNFFENRATEYAKGAVMEDWDTVTTPLIASPV